MQVHLEMQGQVDRNGLLDGLEFGAVKKLFRGYLDADYDHHLLLNANDPWAQDLDPDQRYGGSTEPKLLPGLKIFDGDPTTENIARWIAQWAANTFSRQCEVIVEETHVNAATSTSRPRNGY